jgi:hypothetical protein
VARHVLHLGHAFFLKARIADCQDLVYKQEIGFQMRRNRERQSHVHP